MKVLGKISLAALLLLCAALLIAAGYYFAVTADTKLERGKLVLSDCYAEVFDDAGDKTAEVSFTGSDKKAGLEELPEYVKNAFIAAEDKKFYRHRGLDYARMAKAALKNLGARSFKQGASTISQQLIKNTHLTNEKTLKRKLKEIRLTRKLEKKYSKDEILELYLNTIYFGHGCYGIAGAADYYFSKKVSELTEAEGAMLAAVIRSPGGYSPFNAPERCLSARNRVLSAMRTQGYLSESEYETACKEPLPVKRENAVSAKSYLQCVVRELDGISEVYSPYSFSRGIRIYTYMDARTQEYAENLKTDADRSGKAIVVEDNKTCGITAYFSSEGNIRRQPGSVLKTLAVYAPAMEENMISPCTPIADEKTDFGGYSPSNYKDEYHGFVSVRRALSESMNVPAVKILAKLGSDKSEKYLARMDLPLNEKDRTLSMALGGVSEGFTLPQLTGAYALFANGGTYSPFAFIKKIEDSEGNVLYERHAEKRRVFSEDTVFLINDILKDAAKTGTAKKLASLPFEVCAKTGTCGNEKGNTDAYTIAYTGSHTVGVWMGNADNGLTDITGGGLPCHYAMLLLKRLYGNASPSPLQQPENVEEVLLDKIAYDKYHEVCAASENLPKQFTFLEYFRKGTAPTRNGTEYSAPQIQADLRCKNTTIFIDVCHTEYYRILIKRSEEGNIRVIYDGKSAPYTDTDLKEGKHYEYSITPYYFSDTGEKICGDEIILPSVYIRPKSGNESKIGGLDDWWNPCR